MFALYPEYELLLAQIQLVLFMLAMGVTLSVADFAPVFRQPADLLYGLTFELIVTPFIALGVAYFSSVTAGMAVGLILIGAMPGGTLSNVLTYIARGNVALSIALTACGTLIAIVTIPVVLEYMALDKVPAEFQMPVWGILREILLCLLLPLSVGMFLARLAPHHQTGIARWCLRLGFFFVAVMVVGSLGSGRVQLRLYHWTEVLVIVVFCLALQQGSILPLRLTKWPPRNFVAIGIEAAIRNIYLAILLIALLFPDTHPGAGPAGERTLGADAFFVVATYGIVSLCCITPLILRIRRAIRREEAAGQRAAPEFAELPS